MDCKEKFPKELLFENIKVSTKTIIAVSNIKFNIRQMHMYLPYHRYVVVKKKRGRRKVEYEPLDTNKSIPIGSIISVENKTNIRGMSLKKKKKESNTYFLNSITIVLILECEKIINVKICKNGKFQITGCKNDAHFIDSVCYIYKHILETEKYIGQKLHHVNTEISEYPTIIFNTVMKNIDFKLGFFIQREKLDIFMNNNTDYISYFEGSINTGVNIKIRSNKLHDDFVTQIQLSPDSEKKVGKVMFEEFKKLSGYKESIKPKYFTFLVFSSGSVIFSGSGPEMENEYKKFISIISKNRKEFEERIEKF